MAAGHFAVRGIHASSPGGVVDGADFCLGVTVVGADHHRSCAVGVAARTQQIQRVDALERCLIAAECFGDGLRLIAQAGLRAPDMSRKVG